MYSAFLLTLFAVSPNSLRKKVHAQHMYMRTGLLVHMCMPAYAHTRNYSVHVCMDVLAHEYLTLSPTETSVFPCGLGLGSVQGNMLPVEQCQEY